MGREIGVEIPVCEYGEQTGWIVRKSKYIGRHGMADRLLAGFGWILLIEFKKKDGPLRACQKLERDRLAKVGVTVHLVDTVAEGIALLDWHREHPLVRPV